MFNEFPDWVMRDMLDNNLPWDNGQTMTAPNFFTTHSLHKSAFLGLWMQPNWRTVAAVRWNVAVAAWEAPDYYPSFASEALAEQNSGWYYPTLLLIDFGVLVHQLNLMPNPEAIGNDTIDLLIDQVNSAQIPLDYQEEMFHALVQHPLLTEPVIEYTLNNDLCHTTFYDVAQSPRVHLFHDESIQVLCINSQGNYLQIPTFVDDSEAES